MTGIQAARAAAEIRDELGEEVELENGHYGEFKVFVDGREVVSAGALAFLGVPLVMAWSDVSLSTDWEMK